MTEKLKPCKMTCPKCGDDDIHRRFISKGTRKYVSFGDEEKVRKNMFLKFKDDEAGRYSTAKSDYITHCCRCCGYRWQTLSMTGEQNEQ